MKLSGSSIRGLLAVAALVVAIIGINVVPQSSKDGLSGLALLVALAALYFVPAIVAFARGHHNRLAIAALNVFLGWSVIGWVGALVWALTQPIPPRTSA